MPTLGDTGTGDPILASPAGELRRMILGYRLSQALFVAAELGIADLLENGPRNVDDLAAAAGAHAPSLYRVLRLLASEGVFAEVEDRHFDLTPLARPLRSGAADSLRQRAIFDGMECIWQSWGGLSRTVRTGEPSFDAVFGTGFFDHLRADGAAGAAFDALMVEQTRAWSRAIIEAYDFPAEGTVVDVGGGRGALIAAILSARPRLRGVVYDLPHVIEGARLHPTHHGREGRFELAAGDFFDSVPAGGDVYILKNILHDWDDKRCLAILRNCRRAMPSHGRLLIVEVVVPPSDVAHYGHYFDLNMMVLLTGRERTGSEYRALVEEVGFELTASIATPADVSVLVASPA